MKKIALLSNVTPDLIASGLKKEYDVYLPGGYDVWRMEIADRGSGLYSFEPDAVFVILIADRYMLAACPPDEAEKVTDGWLDSVRTLSSRLPGRPVFVSSLDIYPSPGSPVSDALSGGIPEALEQRWISGLRSTEGVTVLPLKQTVCDIGRRNFYSRKMWYMGGSPYSLKGAAALADLIKQCCFSLFGTKKKCLALDLDNTLWGGVIGEDGAENVELSDHKEGARFYDAQKCLLAMQRAGVMLAVVSKNNPEDVAPVFDRPEMLLKPECFVAMKINWRSKAENIKELASELNIGLDSFVFLDDNPAEREQMKALCPEVTVLDFPQDTSALAQTVEDAYIRYFRAVAATAEDKGRTGQYIQSARREQLKNSFDDPEDYLKNLEIKADIHIMRKEEMARTAQLAGKTNQFNTTTVRYTESELAGINGSGTGAVITAHMSDRFGSEGLTAAVVLRFDENTAYVDDFIMSCRVMGRRFEQVIFDAAVRWILENRPEIVSIKAAYISTKKNKPVEELYESLGFDKVSDTTDEDTGVRKKEYILAPSGYRARGSVYKEVIAFD